MASKPSESGERPSSALSTTKQDMSATTDSVSERVKMVSLSPADLVAVRHAIGALVKDEENCTIHPKSSVYPPRGLPDGLYRDVLRARASSQYQYLFCSIFYNISLILQILLGAATTAISAMDTSRAKTAITILAAANTVNAGILALMHNSGIPDRFKNDLIEFEKVEMFLEELMNAGIAPEGLSKEDLIAECYERFTTAKATVTSNKPGAYTATATSGKGGDLRALK